ncbi:MAG: hypothetical protein K8R46_03845 [Pirellulales bacterium]|nr:hypothetical protein [Pirellulales bacterium]
MYTKAGNQLRPKLRWLPTAATYSAPCTSSRTHPTFDRMKEIADFLGVHCATVSLAAVRFERLS